MPRHFFAILSETFWTLAIAVIALFAFFVALGAFDPFEILGVTLAVAALTAAWLLHAWVAGHRRDDGHRDVEAMRARERRGF